MRTSRQPPSTSRQTPSDPRASLPALEQLPELLSPRKLEILELVAKGLTNEEIATILGISAGTVRIQLSGIFADLQVSNRTEATAAYYAWRAGPSRVAEVLARPAIAVLPLVALTRTRRAIAAAGALTQDLTTLFARWCWFPVVPSPAPTRSTPPLRELGHNLSARFLVSGSLRTKGPSSRLTIRVDDADYERCLWTEQYDFPDEALFDVQDSICATIVAAAYEVLMRGIAARVSAARHPAALDAWALAHEGMTRHASRSSTSNAVARTLFIEAVERDPNLVLAHFGLGLCHYDEVLNQWSCAASAVDDLLASAQRCIDLAPHGAEGYYLLGRHHQARGRHSDAVGPLEMAIARNPSFSAAHALLAQVLVLSKRPDEGLVRMQHAQRLAPRAYVSGLAVLHFLREEHAEALEHAERALAMHPNYPFGHAVAASSAFWLGDIERARRHASALHALQPDFSPRNFLATFGAGFAGVDRIAKALDSLGLGR